ncbi:MAG: acyl carrier protein [Brevundimonas sp.]|uniref:acyl carrier protein n=1 Tax=Brevundimonas sp. TaxID=1871086 RepID=UPI00120DA034|nr:acyl carrier protein [Brevundimonas sp.]RZJ18941.1 MAG: acyl carrier protein [Brevundimonas sp.]
MTTNDDILGQLATVITDHFSCPDKTIDRTTNANDIVGWDSLAHTMVLMRVEDVFAIELPMEQAFTVQNVGELADLVQAQLSA